jgi:AmmeMemoRadiSam system protein B
MKTVAENEITMCGSGPAAAIIRAAKALGAKSARLVRYATSGDTTGDNSEVVGYAGIIVD